MGTRIVEVALPNGATTLVRAVEVDPAGATKAGWREKFDLEEVVGALEGLSQAVKAALTKVAPQKVTLEFGIELAIKSGKLTGMVVEGQGRGTLVVTLEWSHAPAQP